ncbi:MAG: hypothetical protein JO327_04925 [Nitrososphaeraceae archaeon]|nr:hypothetical protein [Nitrososphaeraceae archaeon]MBV9667456.1 hypothetical protein [Nitrososphaeraceae archaeon]
MHESFKNESLLFHYRGLWPGTKQPVATKVAVYTPDYEDYFYTTVEFVNVWLQNLHVEYVNNKNCHLNNDQILALTLECIKSKKNLKTRKKVDL